MKILLPNNARRSLLLHLEHLIKIGGPKITRAHWQRCWQTFQYDSGESRPPEGSTRDIRRNHVPRRGGDFDRRDNMYVSRSQQDR
jgi:hypothetical protein